MYPYIVCITCTNKNSDMFVTHHLHLSWDHPFFLRGQRTVAAVAAYAAMRLTSTAKYSTQSTLRAQTSDTEIYICRVFWSTAILKCMIVRKSIRRYKQGQWLLTATRFWFNSKIKKKAKMDYETPKLSVSLRDICKTTAALQSTE